ncbi:PaaI family thioesterase [bacterium]|nr:PaaI family thioesterase [bacterium]
MELANNNRCFVCGKENEWGLKLDFELKDNKLIAEVVFDERFQGFKGIIHGGIVGTILDEMMVNLAVRLGLNAVTAEIKIRLKKPTYAGKIYRFEGEITGERKRMVNAIARSFDSEGNIIAEAEGVLVKV